MVYVYTSYCSHDELIKTTKHGADGVDGPTKMAVYVAVIVAMSRGSLETDMTRETIPRTNIRYLTSLESWSPPSSRLNGFDRWTNKRNILYAGDKILLWPTSG